MIQPSLNTRQQRIVALADALAQRFAQRADEHDRAGTFPFDNYANLHTEGYLKLTVPQEYGGEGADLFELVLAQEHLARGDGATALAVDMSLHLVGRLAEARQWPEPIFAAICRDMVDQGALINSAATEPEMGSPSRGGLPATTATRTQGGWLVRGHKTFVTMAPVLRYFAVSVALPPPEGSTTPNTKAIALMRAGTPGLRMVDTWSDGLSLRTSGSYDVLLDDAFVPDDWLVAVETADAPIDPLVNATNMAWFVLSFSAVYLGIGQAAHDAACAYARERVPTALGKPIASLPNIQRRVGEMDLALAAARTFLHETAQMWAQQPEQRSALLPRISAAKYLCTNAAITATDQAMRVAGGAGLTRKLALERYYRDARAGLTQPPNDDMALELIGRTALQAGA